MTTLAKRMIMPRLATDLFDTGNFFGPRTWDFDGDFFDLDIAKRMPSVNIMEKDKEYIIEMAAPGLEKKDFKIVSDNGVLTISSEKSTESSEEKQNYTRREFFYNSFSRSFRLPENSLPEKIEAKYESGVLSLMLPKKETTFTKAPKEVKVL
jgi:HSP20 family protein